MAVNGATLSAIAYVVKRMFWNGEVVDAAMREHPLLMKLSKLGRFGGSDLKIPIKYGNPQGIGATFPGAKAAVGTHTGQAFILTRSKMYAYGEIDGETILAMEDDDMAFVRATSEEISSVLTSWVDQLAFYLYGDGHGDLAVVSGTPAANVITLLEPDDAKKFEIGMYLEVRNAADDTQRAGINALTGANAYKVTAVDEDAGTVTVDDDQNIADTDVIFRYDTRDAVVTGLAGWIPETAPGGSDNFFSVDRSDHPTRLAGHRVDGSGGELKEAIRELAARIHNRKGRPKWGFLNSTNFTTLEQELGSKVTREEGGAGKFGFSTIDMVTPAGTVTFYPDPDCPPDKIYLLDPRYIGLKHLRKMPHIIDDDGKMYNRLTDDDGIEFRARGILQMYSNFPGAHGVVYNVG